MLDVYDLDSDTFPLGASEYNQPDPPPCGCTFVARTTGVRIHIFITGIGRQNLVTNLD